MRTWEWWCLVKGVMGSLGVLGMQVEHGKIHYGYRRNRQHLGVRN